MFQNTNSCRWKRLITMVFPVILVGFFVISNKKPHLPVETRITASEKTFDTITLSILKLNGFANWSPDRFMINSPHRAWYEEEAYIRLANIASGLEEKHLLVIHSINVSFEKIAILTLNIQLLWIKSKYFFWLYFVDCLSTRMSDFSFVLSIDLSKTISTLREKYNTKTITESGVIL